MWGEGFDLPISYWDMSVGEGGYQQISYGNEYMGEGAVMPVTYSAIADLAPQFQTQAVSQLAAAPLTSAADVQAIIAPISAEQQRRTRDGNVLPEANIYSAREGDFIGQGYQGGDIVRYESSSVWGAYAPVRQAALDLGEAIGATPDDVYAAALTARDKFKSTYGQYYTEGTGPKNLLNLIAGELFTSQGFTPEKPLFTPEELSADAAWAQGVQDQWKEADANAWIGELFEAVRIPLIFAGILSGAGAITNWLSGAAGAGAAAAGAEAGLSGGQYAANELAGLALAEVGAGGLAETVTALEIAATAAGGAAATGTLAGGLGAGAEYAQAAGVQPTISDIGTKVAQDLGGRIIGDQLGEVIADLISPPGEVAAGEPQQVAGGQAPQTTGPPTTTPSGRTTAPGRVRSGRRLHGTRGQLVEAKPSPRRPAAGRTESILTALGGSPATLG